MTLNTKRVCAILFIVLLLNVSLLSSKDTIDPKLWEKALKIHDEAIVVDTHTDTPMIMYHRNIDIGKRTENSNVDLIRMKEGGLDAIFLAVFVSNHLDKKQPSKLAMEVIDSIYRQVEKYPDLAQMAYSAGDIERIHRTGKRAILIGMENGGPVEGSLAFLRNYYRLGVRYITLTHGSNNDICDSSTDEKPQWNGLSPFGKEMVQEMNRLGMIIDVSHISDQAFWDVMEISKAPVMASHSCVRAICDVPRNLTDDMIKALAKNGGVIQINFFSTFLSDEYGKKAEAVRKKLEPFREELKEKYKDNRSGYWTAYMEEFQKYAPPSPSIDVLIDHIDHVVKLVGADYAGLGSEFDGASDYPVGLKDVTGYPMITYKLLQKGYSANDIKKILGGNFLRVFRAIETAKQ